MQFKSFMESLTTEEKTIEVTMKSGHKFTAPIKVTHKDWHIVKHPVSGKQYRVDHKGNTLEEEIELDEADVQARADYKLDKNGRKYHKQIAFRDGSNDEANEKNEVREETEMNEEMTDAQKAERERIVKGMKKNIVGFKAKYGERAKEVMYATATKQAMKEETLEEGAGQHKVLVTVSDPNHPMVSKRKETIMKRVIVSADHKDVAVAKAKKFYQKNGYKVHNAEYHSAQPKSSLKTEEATLEEKKLMPTDMTGKTCEKCKKDKYYEREFHDDMDGVVRCSCGHKVDRWRKNKEKSVAEEVEQIDERNKENATRRKMMDASRGARWKVQNKVSADDVRDWDGKHKTAQAQNKAIGRALRSEEATLDEAQYGVNLGSRPVSGQKEYQGKEIKSFHPNKEKEAREFADKHGYVVKKNMLPAGNSITHTWDIHKEEVELDEAIKLGSKVKVHAPGKDYHGEVGHVGEIRHGAYKGAPKTYTVDYGDRKSVQLDKKNVKLHKEEVELEEGYDKTSEHHKAARSMAREHGGKATFHSDGSAHVAFHDKVVGRSTVNPKGTLLHTGSEAASRAAKDHGKGKVDGSTVHFKEEFEQISETPVTKAKQPYRPGSIDPATGKTREAPRGTMAYDKAQREKKLKEELEQEAAEVSEGYRGNSEADKPFFDAQDHKKAAEKARKSGDHFSYHKHMSAHHDAMEHWSNNKGRTHVANQHAMKADEHEDYAQQARLKKEQFSIDEEGNLMSEKLTYAQFMEQLYVTIEEAKDDYWDFKDLKDEPKSTTRKVSGTRYGGSAQKDDPEDDEHAKKSSEPAVKRGRGRPAGSKSGANQKVTSGKSYGGIATHSLHLPNSNR